MATLTQEEFNRLVQDVTDAIQNKSNDPSQFEVADSLSGITSLPVLWNSGDTWQLKRVLISLLKGADGREIELRETATAIQWRYAAGDWADLFTFQKLLQPATDLIDTLQGVIDVWNNTTKLELETAVQYANAAALNANEKANAAAYAASEALTVAQGVGQAIEAATNAADNAEQKANEAQTAANNAVIATEGANAAKNAATSAAVLADEKAVEAATATEAADTATALAKAAAENVKDGKTPQFQIGTVEKTAPGGDPVVMLTDKGEDEQGNPKRAINITLPTGDTGAVPVIEMGTITTIAPGGQSSAELVENGTTEEGVQKYLLNMSLVKGDTGDIENIDTIPIPFTEAEERTNINTGETFPALFGKIQKWFSSFKALAFKDTVDWDTDVDNKPTIPNAQVNSDWNASSGVAEIRNKPYIPAKTSDLTNDSNYQNATQVSASITAHNASETAHTDIRDKVDTVDAIARGKARARVFDTVAELDAWLAVPANVEELQVGDNFYIRAVDVPDYWWDGARKLALEGEKVDLTEYAKTADVNTSLAQKANASDLEQKVDKIEGKGLSAHDLTDDMKGYIDFMLSEQTVTAAANIPAICANTTVNISTNQTLSIASPENLKPGYVMTIRINNTATAARTITLPSNATYINDFGTTLSIPASSRAEVSVYCFTEGKYSIRVGEVG